MLIQGVRTIFGAQNVQVENPAFMSGGIEILTGVVLPYSRIVIIGFAAVVLVAMGLLLVAHAPRPLRARRHAEPRDGCVRRRTHRARRHVGVRPGLAASRDSPGCALSQIGNVGPDLGQCYIVDSFMVVVLGGVGQLAGTVYAALGLGFANKLLESWSGAVLAKIAVLVFIIVFIQKRPQGMFALKGRAVGIMIALVRARGVDRPRRAARRWSSSCFPVLNLVVPAGNPFHVSAFCVTLGGKIMCYMIVAVAMDLVWGYAGILSLGHGLFFALGGYAFGMYLMRQIGADGQYRVEHARLHGVPRLEGVPLAVVELRQLPGGRCSSWSRCRGCSPSCSATSRSARA